MNKYVKKGFCLALAVGMIASSFAGCKKIEYVTNGTIKAIHEIKSGDWEKETDKPANANGDADAPVIKELEPNTYGGVEFKTLDDVAKYYKEAYDYTKSLTAEYIEKGEKKTYYKLLGDEDMKIGDVMIDGKSNAIINGLVPGIANPMFKPNTYGLVPSYNRNPDLDNNSEDKFKKQDRDFRTSFVTGEDILAANVTDNKDGTITLEIQPKAGSMSLRGEDSAGRFFEVLGDISGVMKDITVLSFESGTVEENVKVIYKGGTVKVKIDTATKEIVEADYNMVANIEVNHATIKVIKDKSASLIITYKNHFPASDQYLKEKKEIERVK